MSNKRRRVERRAQERREAREQTPQDPIQAMLDSRQQEDE